MGVLSFPGDLALTWIVLFQTKITLQLGVFLILLIPPRLSLVYMALLTLETNLHFGTPSLLLVIILFVLSCALVISILCLTSLRSKEASWLLAPPLALSRSLLITQVWWILGLLEILIPRETKDRTLLLLKRE